MLEQTRSLCKIFSKEQMDKINLIIQEMEAEGWEYSSRRLWEFDKIIGGIGGYCQHPNAAKANYFQGTEFRNAYRCLQYIRGDIDISNVNVTARYIVENCGHYLEEIIKLYIKKTKKHFFVKKEPLGKLLQHIRRKRILEEDVIDKLSLFVDLYNISKHEILSDETLDRTFHMDDAIICYFACRIVGKELLLRIDKERMQEEYEIVWDRDDKCIMHF